MEHMDLYELTGRYVENERRYYISSVSSLARSVGVAASTLYKFFEGSPTVRFETLRKIEKALTWPDLTIDALRRGDVIWLDAQGFPSESLRRYKDALMEHADHAGTA